MKAIITHLDTCSPDYFQGNGNRPMAAIPIDGAVTFLEIFERLKSDDWAINWEEISPAHVKALADELRSMQVAHADTLDRAFDDRLEIQPDDDSEPVYAYFGLAWSE